MFGKDAIVTSLKLFIITAVAALCLAVANKVTFPVIAENSVKAENEALRAVLAEGEEFKTTEAVATSIEGVSIEKVNVALAEGKTVGYKMF